MTTAEKVSQMIVFAATSFPMPINLGATFNRSLVYRMGSVISTEARAFNNEGRTGLDFFTPNINIFRDPRWGRGQETPGEDPFLTSEYVYALIDGLQRGDDDRYLKIAADCKHYAAYDLENSNGTSRTHFNAIVSDQDLVETIIVGHNYTRTPEDSARESSSYK
jgi:beta-glucosidase-like glycosyl hydrolase